MKKITNKKAIGCGTQLNALKNQLKLWCLFIAGFLFQHHLAAQDGFADFSVRVYEAESKNNKENVLLSDAEVNLFKGTAWVDGAKTNAQGQVRFTTLSAGEYSVITSKMGYLSDTVTLDLKVGPNSEHVVMLLNLDSLIRQRIPSVDIRGKKKEVLIIVGPSLPPLDRQGIMDRGPDAIGAVTKSTSRIISNRNGNSFVGSRTDGNPNFVDGAKDNGTGLNTLGTEMLGTTIGGVPANKGDFTGGSFDWVTRSAGLKRELAAEMMSSWMLDPFGYSSVGAFASGPLLLKKYKVGNTTRQYLKLGYVLNGQLTYAKDAYPTYNGVYMLKDESRNQLQNNPLTYTPRGFVYSASYLTQDDFEHVKAHPNSPMKSGNFYGKLEFRPNLNTKLVGFAKFTYNNALSINNSIMNYDANARSDSKGLLAYLQFTQNLKTSQNSAIQNAFYTIRAEYSGQFSQTRDAVHLDNIFDYGYLGSFKTYSQEVFDYSRKDNNPNSEPKTVRDQYGNDVQLRGYWEQTGWTDTALTFEAAGKNPLREAYTRNVYDIYASRGLQIQNKQQIANNLGLLNGLNPSRIYSLWSAMGTNGSSFAKSSAERISIFSQAQFSIRAKSLNGMAAPVHDLQAGFYYEQAVQRGYSLNANDLWTLMPQLANTHLTELDLAHPILSYDANGVFTDTVRYNRLVNYSQQTGFDRAFRNSLIAKGARDVNGKLIDEKTLLDVNSYAPGDFKLDMFNADELLNNGNGVVSYYGYDHLGNKTRGKKGPEGFLNDKNNRSIDAFMPVYTAAWLQDQFRFKDLIFRLGLRMERYDANQSVLNDPWSLFPIKTAGEVSTINGANVNHPANIGSDYKVYVNDVKSPTSIIGYRNGDRWYNADGSEQSNPEFLANKTTNGQIAPLLVNPGQTELSTASLRDFKPSINLLPRLWFTFPLVPNKQSFFVSYDVMAQRPNTGGSLLTIDELYYLKNRQGNLISNGQLGARIRTNYEAGYKHIFGIKRNKGLEFSASYSEVRKDFGLARISQAYPVSYITYRNIDFSTITAFQTTFVMSDIGPLSLMASYMLQYADGSGSNINSQAALIASNQPNLRNVIPLGELDVRHNLKASATFAWKGGYDRVRRVKLYTGPVINGVEVLKNTTINFTANTYSGLPYTPTTRAVQIGATDRAQVKGVPFGARMPWQKFLDINISKNFIVNKTTNPTMVQAFLSIQNVFNTQNIVSVFPFTGQANDDGFLNSSQGQQAVQNQISAQSYTDMYKMLLNSQNSAYGTPRIVRFGMRLFFNQQ